MALYKSTNVDHPMDQLEKTVADLSATVASMTQQIAELQTAKHQHNHEAVETISAPVAESYPDPVKHKYISFVKSAVRIAAGISLIWPGSLMLAGIFLIVAEILGVVEEVV